MLRRFRKYVVRKGLTVNLRRWFPKEAEEEERGENSSGVEEELEKVKEMKYLGYTVEKNGKAVKHIQERIRKAAVAKKRTWHIGERLKKDKEVRGLSGECCNVRGRNLGLE